MNCPKCGNEWFWPIGGGRYYCQTCGYEEKVKEDTRMVCPVCGASAICLNCKPKVKEGKQ